ncbi:MAG TPA: TolC family protein, partial [Chitinophagaceae bacterium]|nr:TolC family protein [Chitinophagaceae bacterium]
MNKRKPGLVVLGLFAFTFLNAQEGKLIRLDEAIDLSIKNSKELKVSQAKIEEATAALKQAVNNKLPDAKVSAAYLRLNSANVDIKLKSNNPNGTSETPKISQAVYGILNGSLPVYA